MLNPSDFIILKPQFEPLGYDLISFYLTDIYFEDPSITDYLATLLLSHYCELERTKGKEVIRRAGDGDLIVYQSLTDQSFWNKTVYGMLYRKAKRGRSSYKMIRPTFT